ncbi:MAG TPA: hypothetical protein VNV35_11720 [Puia sp.]|nr:hypothetical protein [Puia sp.]
MGKIRTLEELRDAIRDLEHQNYVNEQHMRRRVEEIADRLKPANLVRNLLSQLLGGSNVRSSLWRMAAGLVTSLLVKKFFRKGIAR